MIPIRKGLISAVLAGYIGGELDHRAHHGTDALSATTPPVHAPEEPSDTTARGGAVAPAGSLTGRIVELRTGDAPISLTAPDTGLLLAMLTANSKQGQAEGTASNSGIAGHFRVKDDAGHVVFQGTITDINGDGELRFENRVIVADGLVVAGPPT